MQKLSKPIGIFLLLVSSSCSFLEKREEIQNFPSGLEHFFTPSNRNEGGGTVTVSSKEGVIFSGQADYLQKGEELLAQIYDPLGGVILDARHFNHQLSFRGEMAKPFNKLTIDPTSHFIFYDGYFLGLRVGELLDFVKFRLPKAWQILAKTKKSLHGKTVYALIDDSRTIYLRFARGSVDIEVTWSSMLGLVQKKVHIICDETASRTEVDAGDYKMVWQGIDDENA